MSARAGLKFSRGFHSILLSLLLAPLLSVRGAAQSPPIFPTEQFSTTTGDLVSVAAGDLNGDGQPDLAYISLSGATSALNVLLNQGTNNAYLTGPMVPLSNCPSASAFVLADMNKDSKLDAVFLCSAGYVVMMLGNGDGSFQNPAYYAVSGPQALTTVDLNGDGYPDVAVSSFVSNTSTVGILLNQGNTAPGVLSTVTNYPTPGSLNGSGVGSGDFNGDGKPDVLVAGAVYFGNGDGTLQTAQAAASGGRFVIADLNHDGLSDVASVTGQEEGPGSLQVFLGNGNGKFITGFSLPLDSWLGNPFPVLAGATKGGNNVDIAIVNNYTTILLGDGNGGFTYGPSYALGGFPATSETGSDGKTNIVLNAAPGLSILAGNGDGTFQGIPRELFANGDFSTSNAAYNFVTADVNGDGLSDILAVDGSNLISALGRGDGTFSAKNSIPGKYLGTLVTGDFNGDGKMDAVDIAASSQDSALYFFAGNGDGTFQPSLAGVDLQEPGAQVAVAGDFNGDGLLDVLMPYSGADGNGLIFLPGKGDGTFGSPVAFSQQNSQSTSGILVADLNNDKKLDFLWNGAVYLGNGDGTFEQTPLGLTGTALAVTDLNGDGIPDVVTGSNVSVASGSVYAGNGDGTFQTSPFYTLQLPDLAVLAAYVGDLNGDGHPDLVLQCYTGAYNYLLTAALGDGAGNFTLDSNAYYTSFFSDANGGALARLNNQAPKLPNDSTLDFLAYSIGGVIPLLNQRNASPTTPTAAATKTVLSVSADAVDEQQQVTFTAAVTGLNPTGTVSFEVGDTTLGFVSVSNGLATLSATLAGGVHSVTASYSGDSENLASVSNAVIVTVTAPDFTVSISPATTAISAGQSAMATLTITPVAGYQRTVTFSCSGLPSEAACVFSPASVTSTIGAAATTTITITTTAPSTQRGVHGRLAGGWLGMVVLLFTPLRLRRSSRRRMFSALLCVFLLTGLVVLSGCGGSGAASTGPTTPTTPANPGTPSGTQSIAVTASDGNITHTISLQVVVQ